MNSSKRILVLSANPKDTARLRLDEEVREIEEGLRRSKYRDQFEIKSNWAVRLRDIRRAIMDYEPQIVHFCGFGEEDGLKVEDETGNAIFVYSDALSGLFELFAGQIQCVLLNADYSAAQAEAINKHIDYVIGMNQQVPRKTAIEFAVGFYDALGAGKPVEEAFKFGCNAAQFYNISKSLNPVLYKNPKLLAQRKQKTVFLCYSHKDEILHSERLAKDLKKYGIKVWYAAWSALPGASLLQKISKGIQESDYFIVLLTPNSIDSRWVNFELGLAFNRYNKEDARIIPVIFGDCEIPNFLKSFIYVDFKSYASGLKKLLRVFEIESQVLSEPEVKKLILRVLPPEYQAHITKYVLAKDNPKDLAVKEIRDKKMIYFIIGWLIVGLIFLGLFLGLFSKLGALGMFVIPFGSLILGVNISTKYSGPKNAVDRYFKLLSRYEELSKDIAPDLHLKDSGDLYYEFLDDNDKRFYRKYHFSENDIDKSLKKCKLWYTILGGLTLIVFIVLLTYSDSLPEENDIVMFFVVMSLLLGLHLYTQYSKNNKKIHEMFKLKKDFERIREVFIND
ncbi:MAG: toll/interleukin-1 receptor domain-containing protein [Candidatus Aminicenantes bacterium]|nr:MAG: toll/interleukin-1 receptor domain-containing protein [Candidatus Aminicenantes bacterium]